MEWFRLYHDLVRDTKLRRHTAEIRWVWITVLCLASQSPRRGYLLLNDEIPVTPADIEDESRVPLDIVEQALTLFQDDHHRMLDIEDNIIHVTNWDKRQFKSDNSYDRVKKHRDADVETLQKRFNKNEEQEQPPSSIMTKDMSTTLVLSTQIPTDTYTEKETFHETEVKRFTKRDFEIFYSAYPLHKAKSEAKTAWEQMLDKPLSEQPDSMDALIKALDSYKAELQRPGAPSPAHPATWIRKERWTDEPTPLSFFNSNGGARQQDAPAPERPLPPFQQLMKEQGIL